MIDHPLILLVAFPVAAYLIGSVPFGYIIGRCKGVNLCEAGSGNIGATNVGRVLGRKCGCLCFALDVLKGLLPVLAAGLMIRRAGEDVPSVYHQAAWLAVAMGTILGHVFTLYLRFRGGKGVATSLGVLLGVFPYFTWPGLIALIVWAGVLAIWRYVSLASIVAAASFPALFACVALARSWPLGRLWPLLAFAAVMAALVIVRHLSNISRLLRGTESRVGRPKAGQP
jgi:glycerol-3-phosphate acyltransferase PlsY